MALTRRQSPSSRRSLSTVHWWRALARTASPDRIPKAGNSAYVSIHFKLLTSSFSRNPSIHPLNLHSLQLENCFSSIPQVCNHIDLIFPEACHHRHFPSTQSRGSFCDPQDFANASAVGFRKFILKQSLAETKYL